MKQIDRIRAMTLKETAKDRVDLQWHSFPKGKYFELEYAEALRQEEEYLNSEVEEPK